LAFFWPVGTQGWAHESARIFRLFPRQHALKHFCAAGDIAFDSVLVFERDHLAKVLISQLQVVIRAVCHVLREPLLLTQLRELQKARLRSHLAVTLDAPEDLVYGGLFPCGYRIQILIQDRDRDFI